MKLLSGPFGQLHVSYAHTGLSQNVVPISIPAIVALGKTFDSSSTNARFNISITWKWCCVSEVSSAGLSEAIKSWGGGQIAAKSWIFQTELTVYTRYKMWSMLCFFPPGIALSNNRHNTFSRVKNTKPSRPRPTRLSIFFFWGGGGKWYSRPPIFGGPNDTLGPPPLTLGGGPGPPVPTPLQCHLWMFTKYASCTLLCHFMSCHVSLPFHLLFPTVLALTVKHPLIECAYFNDMRLGF